jgi:hypothetical protein
MFDLHNDLNKFYNNHVRLGEERQVLADHRDRSLDRLKGGLIELNYPSTFDHQDQGSYVMHTINQHPNKDYDLDEAIIFDEENLPSSPLNARRRIQEALIKGGGNFKKDPEALTNAVRVYYAEGHHIDFAVYRKYINDFGTLVYEHAGSEWSPRNPADITNWFNSTVHQLSPSKDYGATVQGNQMRRIVRFIKKFTKSREQWDLPGGLIISVLVAECYVSHLHRDDISLYDTLIAIRNRLIYNEDVYNPVDKSQKLTNRPVDQGRIRCLRGKLDTAETNLAVLFNGNCDEEQAKDAWFWFFQHSFWVSDEETKSVDEAGKLLGKAARNGAIFVSKTGQVTTVKPNGNSIPVPKQQFFGEDE